MVASKNGLWVLVLLACSRRALIKASRLALYNWPLRALQGLHEGTMLFMSALPSGLRSCSMRWSASVAVPPHQWHGGLPARSCCLAARYAGSDVLRGIVGWSPVFAVAYLTSATLHRVLLSCS
jgi:hypothetical protein